MMKNFLTTLCLAFLLGSTSFATAGVITCNDKYRTASVGSADGCYSQVLGSTAKQGDINTIFGGNWAQVGELTTSGSNSFLSVSGWGSSKAGGTWSINPDFWQQFGSAVISVHVGGGQKNAVDNFEWLITPGTFDGSWSYAKLTGKGGGLSNIKLWGSGTPAKSEPPVVQVSEPNPLLLLSVGLLLLGVLRAHSQRRLVTR